MNFIIFYLFNVKQERKKERVKVNLASLRYR